MNDQTVPPTPPEQPPTPPQSSPTPPGPAATTEAPPAKKKGGWGKWVAIGCGCLTLILVIIVALAAIFLLPIYQKAGKAATDLKTVTLLRNAVTAAATYYVDKNGSYEGLNADELGKLESSVRFKDGTPGLDMEVGIVYVDPSASEKQGYVMAAKSESGTLFRTKYSSSGLKFEQSDDGTTWVDVVGNYGK